MWMRLGDQNPLFPCCPFTTGRQVSLLKQYFRLKIYYLSDNTILLRFYKLDQVNSPLSLTVIGIISVSFLTISSARHHYMYCIHHIYVVTTKKSGAPQSGQQCIYTANGVLSDVVFLVSFIFGDLSRCHETKCLFTGCVRSCVELQVNSHSGVHALRIRKLWGLNEINNTRKIFLHIDRYFIQPSFSASQELTQTNPSHHDLP